MTMFKHRTNICSIFYTSPCVGLRVFVHEKIVLQNTENQCLSHLRTSISTCCPIDPIHAAKA